MKPNDRLTVGKPLRTMLILAAIELATLGLVKVQPMSILNEADAPAAWARQYTSAMQATDRSNSTSVTPTGWGEPYPGWPLVPANCVRTISVIAIALISAAVVSLACGLILAATVIMPRIVRYHRQRRLALCPDDGQPGGWDLRDPWSIAQTASLSFQPIVDPKAHSVITVGLPARSPTKYRRTL